MPDLYPVTDDDLSEAELTNWLNQSNLVNYVESGSYTPDHTNEEVTADASVAYIRDTSGDLYKVEPDQATLSFPDQNGTNYLYITFDPTDPDPESTPDFEITATEGSPADPKLKRAEIDASADTDTSFNDNPDIDVGDLTVNGSATGTSANTASIDDTDSPYTTQGEDAILADTSGGAVTVELATADLSKTGPIWVYNVSGSNAVTVQTEGSETIDPGGESSKSIGTEGDGAPFSPDGSNWDAGLDREFDSVTTDDLDIDGSDLVQSGDVLLSGPSDTAHQRDLSQSTTSYNGQADFQLKRVTWDSWLPEGATSVVYAEMQKSNNIDVRLQNTTDGETIASNEGTNDTVVTLGPVSYTPTTTGSQIQIQVQSRSQDGASGSVLDFSLEMGIQL